MVPLIPAPVRADALAGDAFRLGAGTPVAVGSPDLDAAARVFRDDVARDTGLALADGGHRPGVRVELATDDLGDLAPTTGVRAGAGQPDDERYGLSVTADGVRVWAATPEGVHRGLTSLRQLIVAGLRADGIARIEPVRVLDTPRYAWRGLSLDVVRTFHDAAEVLRVIDMLSAHKLNVLHLHLTDDQGWRVPIAGWPALTEAGGAYTVEDLERIGAYARERHVTVVPEIDLPGHVQAVSRSYPELGPLDPDLDLTWRFVHDVLAEVARLFPDSRHLHIGGDEAFGMADETHARFVTRAAGTVRSLGRRVVGWQETARADVGPDDIVQQWIDPAEALAAVESGALARMLLEPMAEMIAATMAKAAHDVGLAADKGASVLLSTNSHLNLERPYAEWATDAAGESLRDRLGVPFYPAKTVAQSYDWEPDTHLAALVPDRVPVVAGVEAAVWCETVTSRADLEFLLLPRLAGVAERAWSPRGVGVWAEYRERLAAVSPAWKRRGWTWFRSSAVDW